MELLSAEDMKTLSVMTDSVLINKHHGIACKLESPLSKCDATIYHMGKDNPVIRIDLKIKEEFR